MIVSEEPSALEGDDLLAWSALATVLVWLPNALDAQLQRDSGPTHFEYGILFALSDARDQTLRMSVLAGFANSSLTRLSRAVGRLERRGWIARRPDPNDGRYTLAVLTADGAAKVEQAGPGHVATVQKLVLKQLTRAQTRQLREISLRITTGIRASGSWNPTS